MGTDAENRASSILLPGQQLPPVEITPPETTSSNSNTTWSPAAPAATFWEQVVLDHPLIFTPIDVVVLQFSGQQLEPWSLSLQVKYVDDTFAETIVDDGTGALESLKFSARMNYQTGALTVSEVAASIEYIQATFQTKQVAQ